MGGTPSPRSVLLEHAERRSAYDVGGDVADSPEERGLMVLVRAAIQLLAREVQEEPNDGEREKSPLRAADD